MPVQRLALSPLLVAWCLACVACLQSAPVRAQPPAAPAPVVFAAFASPLEEPWNMVIHDALLAAMRGGRIRYTWQADLDSPTKIGAAIAAALPSKPDIVVADATGAEQEIRLIAAAQPKISFLIGSAGEPAPPNLSVFDSDLAEPAYLCGLLAGQLTKSNVVGVVAGKSDPAVNRTVNAYLLGARTANPAVQVKVDFIDSWFDPPKAREATLKQIAAGADLVYAEREGAIAAARERGVLAFGNLIDQHAEAPDTVITGPVWNLTSLVDYVLKHADADLVHSEKLLDFSTLARGGAALAPWHGWEEKLPAEVLEMVREQAAAIKSGRLTIDVGTERPAGD